MKKRININDVTNIIVEGVDASDYPKFCDAYFAYAEWKDNGDELTEIQLEWLQEDYPEVLNQKAFETLI